MKSLKEIWEYRQMISSLVKKDLRTRYKGSVLGFLWTFINPLLQLVIYSLVFSVIMRVANVDNYAIYLFVALIPWIFCQTSLTAGSTCIIASAGLVEKVYFPRIVLPISNVLSNFINMLLSFIIVFAALIVTGYYPTAAAFTLPIIMIIEFFFVLGLVFIFSALTVYFRDLEHILGIFTMAWMYITPILYTIDMIPEKFRFIADANPMTGIVVAYRDILYYGKFPDFSTLWFTIIFSVITTVVGYFIFQKLQKKFAEEL